MIKSSSAFSCEQSEYYKAFYDYLGIPYIICAFYVYMFIIYVCVCDFVSWNIETHMYIHTHIHTHNFILSV